MHIYILTAVYISRSVCMYIYPTVHPNHAELVFCFGFRLNRFRPKVASPVTVES